MRRLLRRLFGSLYLAGVVLVGAPVVALAVVLFTVVFMPLPASVPVPRALPVLQPTVLYAADGARIATIPAPELRLPIPPGGMPAVVEEAVIADEDRNYFHEGGIDLRAIARAALADLRSHRVVQGASTITEQYVKLVYTDGHRSLLNKVREALLASRLDRVASKQEILTQYLDAVYLGDGDTGVVAAAEDYFHTPVSRLDASQAATLAGLIPAPSARAPRQDLGAAEQFRELVLGKMLQQHDLTVAQYRRAMAERLALGGPGRRPPAGATVVYPPPSPRTAYPAFVAYVEQWLQDRFGPRWTSDGLRVQTTLQPAIQAAAQRAVDSTLSGTPDRLEMGLAAVQPQTGYVEALVPRRSSVTAAYAQRFGGDDFALGGCPPRVPEELVRATCQSDRRFVGGGGSGRPPGSAWKPFVLATAFERGIPPSKVYPAPDPYQLPGCAPGPGQPATVCQVRNAETGGAAAYSLATATALSINTVYAQVAEQVGCANVARTARSLGVSSALWSPVAYPHCGPYALGEVPVSPLDLAAAYGVFDDHGLRVPTTPVLEVLSPTGKVLLDDLGHRSGVRVLPANVADNVTHVLEGTISSGTGTAARLGRPAAGKTGTTSNFTDAWFAGYTPTLAAAVWMGDVTGEVPMGVVKGVYPVFGGTWPAVTWRAFMQSALAGVPATGFAVPAPIMAPRPLAVGRRVPAGVTPGPASPTAGPPAAGGGGAVPLPPPPPPPPSTTTLPPPAPPTTRVPPPTTTAPSSVPATTGSTTTAPSTTAPGPATTAPPPAATPATS